MLDIKENRIPSTNTVISSFNYGVNAIGQRTGVVTTGTAFPSQPADWTWGYDALGQVISANSPTAGFDRAYEYDQIGNRQRAAAGTLDINDPSATVYEPNPLNQYDAIGAFAPSYDADGNQKGAQILPLGSSSLVSCVYHWDAENRLVAVKDTNGADIVSYIYDSQSRRVARTEGSNTTLYLYDGWNCLAEYSTSDLQTLDLKTSYTWGLDLSGSLQGAGGVGGLLSVTKHEAQNTTHFFPTFDGNGNISEYLTASGSISAHYEYDPFGRNTVANGLNAGDFAYRFSTKPRDPSTGLYYYGYRFYDPVTGRWPSRDLIEERGGVNLYGFVGNAATWRFDLLGLVDSEVEELEIQIHFFPDPGFLLLRSFQDQVEVGRMRGTTGPMLYKLGPETDVATPVVTGWMKVLNELLATCTCAKMKAVEHLHWNDVQKDLDLRVAEGLPNAKENEVLLANRLEELTKKYVAGKSGLTVIMSGLTNPDFHGPPRTVGGQTAGFHQSNPAFDDGKGGYRPGSGGIAMSYGAPGHVLAHELGHYIGWETETNQMVKGSKVHSSLKGHIMSYDVSELNPPQVDAQWCEKMRRLAERTIPPQK